MSETVHIFDRTQDVEVIDMLGVPSGVDHRPSEYRSDLVVHAAIVFVVSEDQQAIV